MNIIFDCDPGHDDAIAILLLGYLKNVNILGITTESGNQTINKTTKNAINVVNYLGLGYKIYKGNNKPLVRRKVTCPRIHGKTGLDGFDFPKYKQKCENIDAVTFIINTLKNTKEKITIITTGPMTNIGCAIKKAPEIKNNIEKIILMGGSIGAGNVTPAAEFNINCDPEAASICFKSKLPIYMIGLDVTRRVLVTDKYVEHISKINNKASIMFEALMKTFIKNQKEVFNLDGGPLHDPVTIAYLINNDLLHFEYVNTTIDTHKGDSYGRTNCDIPDYLKKPKNSYVATNIDVDMFFKIIEDAIKSYGE